MNDNTVLGKSLNTLGSVGQSLSKAVSDEAKKTGKVVASQVGVSQGLENVDAKKKEAAVKTGSEQTSVQEAVSQVDDPVRVQNVNETKDIVNHIYGTSDSKTASDGNIKKQEELVKDAAEAGRTPEEERKIILLQQQLHAQRYYHPTFNRPKPQEERPAEKVEREEKQEEQMKFMEQDKKKKVVKPGTSAAEISAESKVGSKRLG